MKGNLKNIFRDRFFFIFLNFLLAYFFVKEITERGLKKKGGGEWSVIGHKNKFPQKGDSKKCRNG